jgi:hypothetical protein
MRPIVKKTTKNVLDATSWRFRTLIGSTPPKLFWRIASSAPRVAIWRETLLRHGMQSPLKQ